MARANPAKASTAQGEIQTGGASDMSQHEALIPGPAGLLQLPKPNTNDLQTATAANKCSVSRKGPSRVQLVLSEGCLSQPERISVG